MARLLSKSPRDARLWLELLLALAVVTLVLQLFPSLPDTILSALDVRRWSTAKWKQANVVVLAALLSVWLLPKLQSRWRQRRRRLALRPLAKQVPAEFQKPIDPRVGLQIETDRRAKWRRKMIISTARITIGVVLLGALLGYLRGDTSQPRTKISPLFVLQHGELWGVSSKIGGYFRVRGDQDVKVTHVGFCDSDDDGLQLAHRVSVLEVVDGPPRGAVVVCQTEIPYGRSAELQDGFRWIQLPEELQLRAGTTYILAGDSRAESGDFIFCDADNGAPVGPQWNPLFVGDQPESTRGGLSNTRRWPNAADVQASAADGKVFGVANLGFRPTGSE